MKKNILSITFLLIFAAILLFSVILTIKPGASIFYYKISLNPDRISKDEGYTYRYLIKANAYLFPVDKMIFKENDTYLVEDTPATVTEQGRGLFTLTEPSKYNYFIYFAATDNSDPRTNERSYTIYLPVFFFSRSMGLVYLSLLGLLVAWFILFIVHYQKNQKRKQIQKNGWIILLDSFIRQEFKDLLIPITNSHLLTTHRAALWKSVFTWTTLSSFTYIAFEWLFFITKPSFLDLIKPIEKIEIFLQTGFLIAFPSIIIAILLWILDILLVPIKKYGLPLYLSTLLPVTILACLSLMLVDNFTYTLFSFGIVSTGGSLRLLYAIVFIIWFAYLHRLILKKIGLRGIGQPVPTPARFRSYATNGLFIISSIVVMARFDISVLTGIDSNNLVTKLNAKPNIILLGGDGLDAANLSVYGYERITTPTLDKLLAGSLFAENAFTNSAHSTGSIISMLNSRLATQTRVLNTPDILRGRDSFQHLPGILKREGYYTAEIGVIHYIDAYNLNVRNGFDMVNNRSMGENIYFNYTHGSSLDETFYFIRTLSDRLSERLLHIFFLQKMENPILHVSDFEDFHRDGPRMDNLIDLITYAEEPFFVHAHMMVTHGAKFYPQVTKYSVGQIQSEDWMVDFYDDAILSFDADLDTIVGTLERTGKLDNTILVIYSDHGQRYKVNVRIPLMIRFPNEEFAGRIQANVQNLDIAPTILDYLDLPIPDWMEGTSLISGEIPADRLIHSYVLKDNRSEQALSIPPFYQFGYFYIIRCNNWYSYDVERKLWVDGEISDHTAPCNTDEVLLSFEEIKQGLLEHLLHSQFDVTALP
jgi:arylsulfatase A-like enzyme